MKPIRVLVACECSGRVKTAFRERGFDAWSCDLKPSEIPDDKYHIQGDVLPLLTPDWDLLIAHPPCTYLTLAGNRWMKPEYKNRYPNRERDRQVAIEFFMKFANAPIEHIAIENPIGIMSRLYKPPDQIIQPHYFGDDTRKPTCLWLKYVPPLFSTCLVMPKLHTDKNGHTDSFFHYYSFNLPKEERASFRSRTFQGIANAMADQWGRSLLQSVNKEERG